MNTQSKEIHNTPSKVFCPAPWKALVLSSDGSTGPCCMAPTAYSKEMTKAADFYSLQSEKAKNFRKKLIEPINEQDLPKWCKNCLIKEKLGTRSVRTQYQERQEHPITLTQDLTVIPEEIEHFDLSLTNICNFKCRYCSSHNSTKWFDDRDKLVAKDPQLFSYTFGTCNRVVDSEADDIIALLKKMPMLKIIELKGGEPFLAKAHYPLLSDLVQSGRSKELTLDYTTNGSIYDEKISQLWKHFKKVSLSFSADGLGNVFTYSRGGNFTFEETLWPTFLKYAKDKTSIMSLHITVNALNILDLPAFVHWLESYQKENNNTFNVSIGLVLDPVHLKYTIHPKDSLVQVGINLASSSLEEVAKLSHTLINQEYPEEHPRKLLLTRFWSINNAIDEQRNITLKQELPHVWQSLQN